jgi:hypothetical protein
VRGTVRTVNTPQARGGSTGSWPGASGAVGILVVVSSGSTGNASGSGSSVWGRPGKVAIGASR